MSYAKLVIIDTRVEEYDKIIASLKEDVAYVLLDYYSDTIDSLTSKISALKASMVWDSVALVSHSNIGQNYKLVENSDSALLYNISSVDPEIESWRQLKDFFISLNSSVTDLLGCALYMNDDWKYVLNKLESETGIDFRASVDNTGNLAVGGNWVLESDNINIRDVYFNEGIEEWMGVLGINLSRTTAIIDASGRLYTCGSNLGGLIGIGSSDTSRNVFTLVSSISNEIVIQVSISSPTSFGHMACVTDSGKLYTWGSGSRIGIGVTSGTYNTPQFITDLSNRKIISVKCSLNNIICLDSSGYVYSTGNSGAHINRSTISPNRFGRVTGSSTNIANSISNEIITQINCTANGFHAVTQDGRLFVWGTMNNIFGLGSTTIGSTSTPSVTQVISTGFFDSNIKKVECSRLNSAIITTDNRLIVGGNNTYLQLTSTAGDVSNSPIYYYNDISSIYSTDVENVFLGDPNIYVRKTDGTEYFSGHNYNGWSGLGSTNTTTPISPPLIITNIDIKDVRLSMYDNNDSTTLYTMAIDTNNNLKVIGLNSSGQLGTGNFTNVNEWTTINPPQTGVRIVALADSEPIDFRIVPIIDTSSITHISYGQNITTSNISITMKDPNTNASVAGSFTYNPTLPIIKPTVGTRTITWTFTPTNSISYNNTSGSVNINVNKRVPIQQSVSASNIQFGSALSASSITAVFKNPFDNTDVSGTSTFSNPTFVPTAVGSANYAYTFSPFDSVNYDNSSSMVNVTVNARPLTTFRYDISSSSVSFGTSGQSVDPSSTVTGNPITYDISSGGGAGITIDSSGRILWSTSVAVGTYNMILRATSGGTTLSTGYRLIVNTLALTTFRYDPSSSSVSFGTSGQSVLPTTIPVTGASITYDISSGGGAGITIDSSGRILWSTSVAVGTYNMILRATSGGTTLSTGYRLTVNALALTTFRYDISSSSVSFGTSGQSVLPTTIPVTGASITYDISSGGGAGITIDSSGRILWSTSVAVGTYNMILRANNGGINTLSARYRLTISENPVNTLIYDPSSSIVTYGISGNSVVPYVNPTGTTIGFALQGTIPAGITIDTSGRISWSTTVVSGTYNLTARVANNANFIFNFVDTQYRLIVNARPVTTFKYDPSSSSVSYGVSGNSVLPNVTDTGSSITYNLEDSPSGVTIDTSGRIYWSTTVPVGTHMIKANANTLDTYYYLTVNLVPITSLVYDVSRVDISYGNTYTSNTPTVNGSNINRTFSLLNAPNGVTIDNSGVIRVADFVLIGSYNMTVRATNNNINFATFAFTINIRYIGFAYYNNNNPPRLININDASTYYRGANAIAGSSGVPVYTITTGGTPVYKIKQIRRVA